MEEAGAGGDALRPTLRARDAVAITLGIVIGAGIFRSPSLVAGAAGSADLMLAAWVVGGAVSIIGALCYAEMACAYPQAGGDYAFLRRAFGRKLAFLYAWSRLAVIQTGSIALLAFVFGDYASQLVNLGPASSTLYAAGAVVVLTAVQWIGIGASTRAQGLLTILEVAGLAVVIIAGLLIAPAAEPAPPSTQGGVFGLVMVFVLLTYGGWSEAAYVSAELKDAPRRMPLVLILSLAIITALYLAANAAYLRALGMAGMAESEAVAADVLRLAFGPIGAGLISLFVAVAALTSANATVFTGARTAYALGRDHPNLAFLGEWHLGSATPRTGLLLQGGLALGLVGVCAFSRDSFQAAVEYTAPVFWTFLLLVGIALFRLRRIDPDRPRPFRAPLYPVLPALFVLANAFMLYSSLAYTGARALIGVAVMAAGAVLLIPLESYAKDKKEIRP